MITYNQTVQLKWPEPAGYYTLQFLLAKEMKISQIVEFYLAVKLECQTI